MSYRNGGSYNSTKQYIMSSMKGVAKGVAAFHLRWHGWTLRAHTQRLIDFLIEKTTLYDRLRGRLNPRRKSARKNVSRRTGGPQSVT
jgi:hypothetical protein